jgi:hypothetical protein
VLRHLFPSRSTGRSRRLARRRRVRRLAGRWCFCKIFGL